VRSLVLAGLIVLASPCSAAPPDTLPPEFMRGVSFAHVHDRGWGYGSARSEVELRRLAALGVRWISVMPFAYQPSVDAPALYHRIPDPSLGDGALVSVIAQAHAVGIQVLLKPHLWSRQFGGGGKWTGDIAMRTEADTEAWWQAYGEYILYQAALAERARADGFLVGLELVAMTRPEHSARWRRLIAQVRQVYRGPLGYGANHDEVQQIDFWDALDAIGVHAYYPLGAALESRDSAAIAEAWGPTLAALGQLSAKWNKPVVLTELGFPAHAGALAEPWRSDSSKPIDEGLQARAYEGTLRALAGAPFVRGIFVWKWFSGGRDNPHESDPFDPSGRAAEAVLGRWFRGR
jgi:hypothetical protein